MHTVDLSSNKLLLVFSAFFGLLLFSVSRLEIVAMQLIGWLGLVFVAFSVILICLIQANKFYVHIDKAGVSYGLGFTVRYIHQESIQAITKKAALFGAVLQVSTLDGKVHHFYAWQINDADFIKAQRLLAL